MEGMEYFYEVFEALPRCGPGGNEHTRRAFNTLQNLPEQPFILDIGCGTGMATLELAKLSNGKIIGIDIDQDALDKLIQKIKQQGLKIE